MFRSLACLFLIAGPLFCAGTAADLARSIRAAGFDPAQCYRVRDLSLAREDIKLYFTDGYLIFGRPVVSDGVSNGNAAGQRLMAAFSGDVEGGDGEVLLLPPNPAERRSLAKFTQSPNLDEHFRAAMMVFTDSTAMDLLAQIHDEGRGRATPEMGPLMSEQWSPVASGLTEALGSRAVQDLLLPVRSPGFFYATIAGKHLGNFNVLYDPRGSEQIMVAQLAQHVGQPLAQPAAQLVVQPVYNIWTIFPSRTERNVEQA